MGYITRLGHWLLCPVFFFTASIFICKYRRDIQFIFLSPRASASYTISPSPAHVRWSVPPPPSASSPPAPWPPPSWPPPPWPPPPGVQCAVCSVQCALCSVQYSVCSVQCAVCSVQCAVCSVQCAVCSVQCAVRIMQCAPFPTWWTSCNHTPAYCTASVRVVFMWHFSKPDNPAPIRWRVWRPLPGNRAHYYAKISHDNDPGIFGPTCRGATFILITEYYHQAWSHWWVGPATGLLPHSYTIFAWTRKM